MRYTVAEKMEGGVYVVIERDDGSSYGQTVSLAGIKTAQELDARVAELHGMAEARLQAEAAALEPSPLDVDALIEQPRTVDVAAVKAP